VEGCWLQYPSLASSQNGCSEKEIMHKGGSFMKNSKGVITGLIVILFLSISTIANAAPRVLVDELVYNVGEIPQGKPIIHDFIVKNTGDKPLEINVKHC
jgi:hypothetical protein